MGTTSFKNDPLSIFHKTPYHIFPEMFVNPNFNEVFCLKNKIKQMTAKTYNYSYV